MQSYRERILCLLGEDDPLAVLESTPARLTALYQALGREGLAQSYAPGKWSAREILAHLAGAEVAIGFRVRQALAEKEYRVEPFDQDAPGPAATREPALGWRPSPSAPCAPGTWISSARFHPRTWRAPLCPERGEESVETIIRMLAGHDRNHLRQLERISGS